MTSPQHQTQAPLFPPIQSPLSSHNHAASQVLRAGVTHSALGSFRRNHDSGAGSTEGLRGPGRASKASREVRSKETWTCGPWSWSDSGPFRHQLADWAAHSFTPGLKVPSVNQCPSQSDFPSPIQMTTPLPFLPQTAVRTNCNRQKAGSPYASPPPGGPAHRQPLRVQTLPPRRHWRRGCPRPSLQTPSTPSPQLRAAGPLCLALGPT